MAQVPVINVISPVAQKCMSCPTTVLVQAYIDAARQLCAESKWLKTVIPGLTIVNTRVYSLGSDTNNEIIGVDAIDITQTAVDVHPLTERSSSEWNTTEANAIPLYYQYVPEGQFAVHPKPNAIYALSVGVSLQPKKGANSVDETLLVNWGYALEHGALAYLLALKDMPWYDLNQALKNESLFRLERATASHAAEASYNPAARPSGIVGPRAAPVRTKMQAL